MHSMHICIIYVATPSPFSFLTAAAVFAFIAIGELQGWFLF